MKREVVFALMSAFVVACDEGSSYLQGPLRLGTTADPTFAVVMKRKNDSAIGLLDARGDVIRDAYIESNVSAGGARIEETLAIPSNPELEGVLTIINGRPTQTLVRIDYFNGKLLDEVRVRRASEDNVGVRDYLYVDENQAWVTRYDPNLDDAAKGFERGDDLVQLDPESGRFLERVDLSSLHERVTYRDANEDEVTELAYARPSKLVGLRDGYAYVGLDRLTADMLGVAPGAGLVVDLDTAKFTTLELEGMSRCGEAVPVVDARDAVIVVCHGAPSDTAKTSGLAYVEVNKGKGKVKYVLPTPVDWSEGGLAPISLGGTRFAVAQLHEKEEVLLIADFASDSRIEVGRFEKDTFGYAGAYEPGSKSLYLPDRANNRILRFKVDAKGAQAMAAASLDSELTVQAIVSLKRF